MSDTIRIGFGSSKLDPAAAATTQKNTMSNDHCAIVLFSFSPKTLPLGTPFSSSNFNRMILFYNITVWISIGWLQTMRMIGFSWSA